MKLILQKNKPSLYSQYIILNSIKQRVPKRPLTKSRFLDAMPSPPKKLKNGFEKFKLNNNSFCSLDHAGWHDSTSNDTFLPTYLSNLNT